MAENYNIGSKFGLNVSSQGSKTLDPQKTGSSNSSSAENLFSSMTNYVDKYENVFNGEVANEINMYSRQAMIVGMNLRAADTTIRKFDMNI